MTQRNVETLLGRLVTNPGLRRRFAADPAGVLGELQDEGYDLTATEIEALSLTAPDAIRSFAESLDRRIRRMDDASRLQEGKTS